MDYGDLLTRAWRVVWGNKYLIIVGFLAALGSAGGTSGPNFSYSFSNEDLPPGFDIRVERFFEEYWPYMAGLACLAMLITLVLWLVRLTAQGGLIGAVDRLEAGEKVSFGEAISAGAGKLGRLVGINVIMYGVFFILGMIAAGLGIALFVNALDYGLSNYSTVAEGTLATLGILLACIGVLFCLLLPVLAVVSVIYPFAQRAAVLEDLSVTGSIGRGWRIIRANLAEVIILVVIFIALGILFGLVIAAIMFPLGLLLFVPWVVGVVDQGTFNFGGFALMAASGICMGLVAAALHSVLIAFRSATVTLAYREFMVKADGAVKQV
jgi:hypothetical protein